MAPRKWRRKNERSRKSQERNKTIHLREKIVLEIIYFGPGVSDAALQDSGLCWTHCGL